MSPLVAVPAGQTVAERIIWLQNQEATMIEQLDANRWEQAELIAAELEGGKTQRQLAEEIRKDPMHVNRMNKVWKTWGVDHGLRDGSRSFDSYYQEVKQSKPEPKTKPKASKPKAPKPTPEPQAEPESVVTEMPVMTIDDSASADVAVEPAQPVFAKPVGFTPTIVPDLNETPGEYHAQVGEPSCPPYLVHDDMKTAIADWATAGSKLIKRMTVDEKMIMQKIIFELLGELG